MDLSFHRRRKAKLNSSTPDLLVLLANVSARQAASRTALAQTRPSPEAPEFAADPLVEIFAPSGYSAANATSFSDRIANPVNPRKLT